MRFFRFRAFLIAATLGITLLAGRWVWAQSEGASAQPAAQKEEQVEKVKTTNPFKIVMDNIDFVFIIIVICSVVGVALIIQGFITVRGGVMMPEESTARIRELIGGKQFKELIDFTESDPTFISRAINAALKRAPSFPAMKEAMETSIGEQTAEQFRKIEYLNIIGNLGPLLGLLGTVIGMIDAFQAMNEGHGTAKPAVLAGGISRALCHTMLGLLLALPCLAAFGVLRTMVDRLTVRGALVAEELLLMVKPAEAKPAAVAAARPAVMPQPAVAAVRKAPIPAPPAIPAQQ